MNHRKNMLVVLLAMALLFALVGATCKEGGGESIPPEYQWRIWVGRGENVGWVSEYTAYCKSYEVSSNSDVLTITDCWPDDYSQVISGSQWKVQHR